MKESNNEDLANHIGPESCECIREGALEALTGESAGRAIEPRNKVIIWEADTLMASGRQHRAHRFWLGACGSRAVGEPWHAGMLLTRKPGDLVFNPEDEIRVRVVNPKGARQR
jgi:hypothetical protein